MKYANSKLEDFLMRKKLNTYHCLQWPYLSFDLGLVTLTFDLHICLITSECDRSFLSSDADYFNER